MYLWTYFSAAEGWDIHAATTREGICRLNIWSGEAAFLAALGKDFPGRTWRRDDRCETLVEARRQLEEYFAGARRGFDLPLDLPGTPYQRRVWAELLRIPYGETRTYAELARRTDSVPRAAGQANGRNPVAVVVPCHRVVNVGGGLGGYGGGLDRKRRLLDLESRARILTAAAR